MSCRATRRTSLALDPVAVPLRTASGEQDGFQPDEVSTLLEQLVSLLLAWNFEGTFGAEQIVKRVARRYDTKVEVSVGANVAILIVGERSSSFSRSPGVPPLDRVAAVRAPQLVLLHGVSLSHLPPHLPRRTRTTRNTADSTGAFDAETAQRCDRVVRDGQDGRVTPLSQAEGRGFEPHRPLDRTATDRRNRAGDLPGTAHASAGPSGTRSAAKAGSGAAYPFSVRVTS